MYLTMFDQILRTYPVQPHSTRLILTRLYGTILLIEPCILDTLTWHIALTVLGAILEPNFGQPFCRVKIGLLPKNFNMNKSRSGSTKMLTWCIPNSNSVHVMV